MLLKDAKSNHQGIKKTVDQYQNAYNSATREKNLADRELEKAKELQTEIQNRFKTAKKDVLEDEMSQLQTQIDTATIVLDDAKKAEEEAMKKADATVDEADEKIKTLQRNLDKLMTDLEKQRETDEADKKIENLDFERKKNEINKQQALVDKLVSKTKSASVTTKVGGIVSTLSLVAGEKTTPGNAIAEIQMVDKGYTLSMSVTNEQASKVKVGDKAEIRNYWGGDISAVLASIKTDKSDPSNKKLLTFNVTGDVTPGRTLNLSVGERSANYDTIVPTSAIREDSNGKFILAVEAKSSPLGNRYMATRYDVTVLASDDTQSAVSGNFSNPYVITTSTKPIEAGMQVRLVENQ